MTVKAAVCLSVGQLTYLLKIQQFLQVELYSMP